MEDSDFSDMAVEFNENIGIDTPVEQNSDGAFDQFCVLKEEFLEMEEAFIKGDMENLAEEMADEVITIFVLADRLGIDLTRAYKRKMHYNLSKSGERDENGKAKDDSEVEKPGFGGLVNND